MSCGKAVAASMVAAASAVGVAVALWPGVGVLASGSGERVWLAGLLVNGRLAKGVGGHTVAVLVVQICVPERSTGTSRCKCLASSLSSHLPLPSSLLVFGLGIHTPAAAMARPWWVGLPKLPSAHILMSDGGGLSHASGTTILSKSGVTCLRCATI